MHPLYEKSNALSYKIIGAAIEVHKVMGSGLHEVIYEKCLMRELRLLPFFHEPLLKNGISRMILPGADK